MTREFVVLIVISVILFLLLIWLYGFVLLRRSPKKRKAILEQIAAALGVPYMVASPIYPKIPVLRLLKRPASVEGEYQGYKTTVYYAYRGNGPNQMAVYVTMDMETNNPHGLTFELRRRGFYSKMMSNWYKPRAIFQDELFESFFLLKSNDTSFMKAILVYSTRMDLYNYYKKHKVYGRLSLKGSLMRYEESVSLAKGADYERLGRIADIMCCLQGRIDVYHNR